MLSNSARFWRTLTERVCIHELELEQVLGSVVELAQAQALDMVVVVEQALALDMALVE